MKTLLFYSRLNFCLLILIVLFSALLIGCKKETDLQPESEISKSESKKNAYNTFSRESTVNSDTVRAWLESQIVDTATRRNEMIQAISENMKDEDIYSEEFRDEENFVIVPLTSDYISEHININNPLPLEFLLLVEDSTGKIRKGDLVLFYPASSIEKLSGNNSFHNFFVNQTFSDDGTFTLITLNDTKQYEMDFDSSKPKEFRLWNSRYLEPTCIDWYLITTYYYSDGSSYQVEEYLYQTCEGGGTGGGVGGNGTYTPPPSLEYISKPITLQVGFKHQGSLDWWDMYAFYTVTGYKDQTNSNLNYFTSITPGGTMPVSSSVNFMNPLQGYNVNNYYYYAAFSELANDYVLGLFDNKASCDFTGEMNYANQPHVGVYRKQYTWQASSVFQ